MQLVISSNSAQNPLSLDLTKYIDVTDGGGLDPHDPNFREALISHSLLKEGGVLALEDLKAKELIFPLRLNSTTSAGVVTLVQQINQIVGTAGATATWQDDGMSQATSFDLITGQFDIAYRYRESQQHWLSGKLRLFSQPLGHTATPRVYAAASGVGPLLMISPYASGGALSIGASTQAGVAGFGGKPYGASSGIFYSGAPSLAGDATAKLQIGYVAPVGAGVAASTAFGAAFLPYTAVSVLPDQNYKPLLTADAISGAGGVATVRTQTGAVASQYIPTVASTQLLVVSVGYPALTGVPQNYVGQHRVFAIARASAGSGTIGLFSYPSSPSAAPATVRPGDWAVYDVGTWTVADNAPDTQGVLVTGSPGAVDLSALVMLPDNATWYLNPVGASSYRACNAILVDDVLGQQFAPQVFSTPAQVVIPVTGSTWEVVSARVTQYSRALPPRPDPKSGLPIIAILGVGQSFIASTIGQVGASWANPQNQQMSAQVSVLERSRYVLP